MTIEEIAKQNGWTLRIASDRSYQFRKGNLAVTFSRRGHGRLEVKWRGYRVPWDSRIGDNIRLYNSTREVYAEALLPLVTEAEAKRLVELSMRGDVENKSISLQNSKDSLEKFLAVVGGAS